MLYFSTVIVAKSACMFINPFVGCLSHTLLSIDLSSTMNSLSGTVFILAVNTLIVGNFIYLLWLAMISCAKRALTSYKLCFPWAPFYWLFFSFGAM